LPRLFSIWTDEVASGIATNAVRVVGISINNAAGSHAITLRHQHTGLKAPVAITRSSEGRVGTAGQAVYLLTRSRHACIKVLKNLLPTTHD
jgi:hypothetical protein